MGPGLFSDIGKRARGVLYEGYNLSDRKFALAVKYGNVEYRFRGPKQSDQVSGEISCEINTKNSTVEVSLNSDSNLVTTVTLNELMKPGLRGIFRMVAPDKRSGKVELQYLHEYAGLTAIAGLSANPAVGLSAVFGTSAISFGADVAFDTKTSNLTKYNAGMSITTAELTASLTLRNQGESLSASYHHLINPATSLGAEVVRRFSNHRTAMAFGAMHIINFATRTMVKARVDNYGMVTAMFQHGLVPHTMIAVSAETDLMANDGTCRVGVALVLQL